MCSPNSDWEKLICMVMQCVMPPTLKLNDTVSQSTQHFHSIVIKRQILLCLILLGTNYKYDRGNKRVKYTAH